MGIIEPHPFLLQFILVKQQMPRLFALTAALLFFLAGLASLNQVGFIWDAPENLLTGTHYARFFASGDRHWLDFTAYDAQYRAAAPAERPWLYNREFNAPFRYPPLANVTAVLTHALFSQRLGWLPDPDGYHLAVLLFAALTVFVVARFTWQAFGPLAGVAATAALVTYPLFVEHARNNLKDVPFAALVLLALWAYWQGERHGRWPWFMLSAVAAGLGMGVRLLAAELWPVIAAAYLPLAWARRRQGWREWSRPYRWLLPHILLALLVFTAVWPWLWPDIPGRLGEHLAFGRDVSRGLRVLYNGHIYESGRTLPWHYTAVIFGLTTPLVVLAGGVMGAAAALHRGRRRQDTAALMLLCLFAGSLLRSSWPGLPQYDGTRHMLEGVIAFMGLFGLGFQSGWRWLQQKTARPWPAFLPYAVLALALLPILVWNIRLHPFQGLYYNGLIGGPGAAFDRYPQAYWGSSFRLGAAWINENAASDSLVLPRVGGHLARYYLDPARQIIPDEAIPTLPPGQPVTLIYMTRRDKFGPYAAFAEAHLTPVFVLERAGVPLLKIVQTDAGTLQSLSP